MQGSEPEIVTEQVPVFVREAVVQEENAKPRSVPVESEEADSEPAFWVSYGNAVRFPRTSPPEPDVIDRTFYTNVISLNYSNAIKTAKSRHTVEPRRPSSPPVTVPAPVPVPIPVE